MLAVIIAGVLFYSNRADDTTDVEDADTTEEVDGDVQGESVEAGDDADADADDADAEGDDADDTDEAMDDEDGEAAEE